MIPSAKTETKHWNVWDKVMPPPPNSLYVSGEVLVSNPGVDALLCPMEPQGVNPVTLMLELILLQRPGIWPRVLGWRTARYHLTYGAGSSGYTSVSISCGGEVIADEWVQSAQ